MSDEVRARIRRAATARGDGTAKPETMLVPAKDASSFSCEGDLHVYTSFSDCLCGRGPPLRDGG